MAAILADFYGVVTRGLASDVQEQMLALPGADHLLIGVMLGRLDVAVEQHKTFTEDRFQIGRGAELHDGVENMPW
jgi:hypothetical protein